MSSLTDIKLTKLGSFVLDLDDQVLYCDADEVAIEPKVMTLLLYLYENRDRYVSIEELHQEVWSDRVVSDTAVRSAVKKLRLILGDTDIANARYVKSVSKRGYKLICEVAPTDTYETKAATADEQDLAPPPNEQPAVTSSYSPNPNLTPEKVKPTRPEADPNQYSKRFNVLILLVIFMAMVIGWVKYDTVVEYIKASQVIEVSELNQLTAFSGEKLEVSVSRDGRYVAFTGRSSAEEDRQVYLLDRHTSKIRQLTHNATNAISVLFAQNDKVLIYSEIVDGQMSVELLPMTLAEPEYGKITLIDGITSVTGPSVGRHSSEVLLPMMLKGDTEVALYALDLRTLEHTRILASSDASEVLHDVSISPDKKKLALVREGKGRHHIMVFDLETKEETLVYSEKHRLRSVEWKDMTTLLVLGIGTGGLHQVDIGTGSQFLLIDDSDMLLRSFDTHNGIDIVVAQKEQSRANRLYIEHGLASEPKIEQIIDAAPQVIAMAYDERSEQHKWAVTLHDGVYTLGRLTLETQEMTPYHTTSEELWLFDVSYQGGGILFKEGPQLAYYSFDQQRIDYITSSMETSSDAAFSADGKDIYYGVNVVGEWETQSYNIQSKISRLLLPGYRSIRPAGSGFIAALPVKEELYYFSDLTSPGKPLQHKIDFRYICRWYVRGDNVVWTTFDSRKTYLHKLNWRTAEYSQSEHRLFTLFPTISADPKGNKALGLSVQINNTSIATTSTNH